MGPCWPHEPCYLGYINQTLGNKFRWSFKKVFKYKSFFEFSFKKMLLKFCKVSAIWFSPQYAKCSHDENYLLSVPWEMCLSFCIDNFHTHIKHWYLEVEHFLWQCPELYATRPYWWWVNIGLGNGLMPPGTCHYLNQCWPRSMSPYAVSRPQWDNTVKSICTKVLLL